MTTCSFNVSTGNVEGRRHLICITGKRTVCSTVYSDVHQRKHKGYVWLDVSEGISSVTCGFPSQRVTAAENIPMSWCHNRGRRFRFDWNVWLPTETINILTCIHTYIHFTYMVLRNIFPPNNVHFLWKRLIFMMCTNYTCVFFWRTCWFLGVRKLVFVGGITCRFVISKSDLNKVTWLPMFSMLFIII